MQVCGRKALGLENLLRLDTVEFQDVTQENRDVSGLVSQEVLVSLDVLATWGAWVASLAAIIATGLTTASVRFASRVANFAGGMVLDEGKSQVFVAIVKGVEDRVVRGTKCRIRRSPEGGQEDGLQDVFHRKVTNEDHGSVKFGDRGEVKIDGTRVVSVPSHDASKFTSKQSSLHALVVERKGGKKSFPYLLGTDRLRGDCVLEHFEGISERGPEFLKATRGEYRAQTGI